jgi:hypothetical protein
MAQRSNLRYYGGQYDSSNMYDNAGPAGVISMYNPESQAQLIDAVAKRQERFDTAKMAMAQEKARIGETETYDMAELTKRLNSFEGGIKGLVKDKYNGDYSAAANEIATMIGTERSNPFYHFNKQKVEMGKAYLDTKMKMGSNFMATNSPFDVSFQDWQNGKTFEFTPVNREDIVRQAATEFGSLKDIIMGSPRLQSTAGGQYFMQTIDRGIKDPKALREYLDKPEGQQMINNIIANNPILAQLPREQLMSAVFEGAHSAIGRTEIDMMPNRGYEAGLAVQQDSLPSGKLIVTGSEKLDIGKKSIYSHPVLEGVRNEAAKKMGKIAGFDVDTYEELDALKGRDARIALKATKEIILQEFNEKYKNASVPVIDINSMWGNTVGSRGEVKANLDGINEYLNRDMATGDLVGEDKESSKLLDGMTDIGFRGVSVIPTGLEENPFVYRITIEGTPPAKGAKKAKPIEVRTLIHPDNAIDAFNLFREFQSLDKGFLQTLYNEYKYISETTGNTELLKGIEQMAAGQNVTLTK